ncbi:HHL282Wp [Eremothecium sinecaudum]|uniref:HHL282Wp n=1 Tax=Eremothecium sinecaudum TaxID=45286 RepID=A0A120K2S7_9SACH|nr:HHL282Wp [Eremothecium sinecaudum]AMD22488.1 HHL282Wp [Eremothecium sinecaudum]
MVISRPTTPELTKELDIPKDIASAMRKSLSHDLFGGAGINEESSPIGTPKINTPISSDADKSVREAAVSNGFTSGGLTSNSTEAFPDYQLWNHYTSDLKTGGATTTTSSYNDVLEILQEWDFSGSRSSKIKNFQRRSSIEDVLKVRHWLNPRSSFSASSMNEPEFTSSERHIATPTSAPNKAERCCWVTLLLGTEDIMSIYALQNSILKSGSKFRLVVLYSAENEAIANRLSADGIQCQVIHPLTPIFHGGMPEQARPTLKWPLLALWNTLYGIYDTVCYMSPHTLLSSNADELLEINDEIDNEVCVLVTNSTATPSMMILKPHCEIHMVLEEFVTVYGLDWEKVNKLSSMNDWNILAELFPDSSRKVDIRYGADVNNMTAEDSSFVKLLDFSQAKPWLKNENIDELYCRIWWKTFRDATNVKTGSYELTDCSK